MNRLSMNPVRIKKLELIGLTGCDRKRSVIDLTFNGQDLSVIAFLKISPLEIYHKADQVAFGDREFRSGTDREADIAVILLFAFLRIDDLAVVKVKTIFLNGRNDPHFSGLGNAFEPCRKKDNLTRLIIPEIRHHLIVPVKRLENRSAISAFRIDMSALDHAVTDQLSQHVAFAVRRCDRNAVQRLCTVFGLTVERLGSLFEILSFVFKDKTMIVKLMKRSLILPRRREFDTMPVFCSLLTVNTGQFRLVDTAV